MAQFKNVVFLGAEESGKTTLANALLGWDIFPQSTWDLYIPTKAPDSQMLTEGIQLTDTPGYSLLWNTVPEDTARAAAQADTLIILLSEEFVEEDVPLCDIDPQREPRREREKALLQGLLEGKTRDILFVIPYFEEDWPHGQVPLELTLEAAKKRFADLSCRGEDGFFCIDPMKALIGEIEADEDAVAASGLLPLKKALLG